MSAGIGEDLRAGPKSEPKNKFTKAEREAAIQAANAPEYRNLSIKQIVPRLADQGTYVGSESTIYRIAREEGQNAHRAASKPACASKPQEFVATAPNQVWSWDITYLMSPLRGKFFYVYIVIDIFSRKIVAHAVHEEESSLFAAALISAACHREGIEHGQLTIHSDNGAPMKGATLQASLRELGVASSFSRPSVSDDNPFSEANFRTMKYRPDYPTQPFATLEQARSWVDRFVSWYNFEHLHSAIRFVTPDQRHRGVDGEILAKRTRVYERAQRKNPRRWSGNTRNWSRVETVRLNPSRTAAAEGAA